ncbi:pentapeptide repeat-containing protein [Streptomyces sp. NPDC050982]|uniref:pentapeptide repeat-containing protein n=1 Tax=Streptomyces sp. NPDC050982 TaxID=3154746 RepID=UPI0033E8142A
MAAAATAAIWFTTGWLLHTTAQAMNRDPQATGADRARVRVEAVRTGLAAGAGAAAAVGLMLAFRRQAHQEHDASERRLAELYNAAAEQLDSDKAPVRLTALYTLERLANDNPWHRQTIVNIICAYLRMPLPDEAAAQAAPHGPDPREEHQVRLTAQRLLTTHLRPAGQAIYWGRRAPIALDLTDAALVDLNLFGCTLGDAHFLGATFTGQAYFGEATFTSDALFRGATFTSDAYFDEATFTGQAYFGEATFTGNARFSGATFTGNARFNGATFTRDAHFRGTTFTGNARFGGVPFTGYAHFSGATFTSYAHFNGATFTSDALFGEASFTSNVHFGGSTFTARVYMQGAGVADVSLPHVFPAGWRVEPTEGTAGQLIEDPAPATANA